MNGSRFLDEVSITGRYHPRRWKAWAPFVAMTVYAVAATSWLPSIPCPFAVISGRDCPTCGTTRAVFSILTGQWLTAFQQNPVGFVVVAAFLRAALIASRSECAGLRLLRSKAAERVLLILFFGASVFHVLFQEAVQMGSTDGTP